MKGRSQYFIIIAIYLLVLNPLVFGQEDAKAVVVEYRFQQMAPPLTEEERVEINTQIADNIRKLTLDGVFSEEISLSSVSLGWPLTSWNGLSDYSYYGISGFVDHNPSYPDALLDFNCGTRTYDLASGYNHMGTDFFTWPFGWYKMDNNQVAVVAAAAGIIVNKSDGNDDRSCGDGNDQWNAVYIRHGDNSTAWYGHMKKNSLTTKPIGSSVAKGEYLGIVGSSGNSTRPHLHFELYDASNNLVDPYYGNCNPKASWWDYQRPYYDSSINAVLTHSAPPEFPTCPQTEILHVKDSFQAGETIYFVSYYRDQLPGQVSRCYILRPDNSVYDSWVISSNIYYDASYWYTPRAISETSPSGLWTFRVEYEGQTYEHLFNFAGKSITVTAPNGGEIWEVGANKAVTWSSTGSILNVRIEYSANNGSTWSSVIASTPNDGSYNWIVPNTPAVQCKIKISSAENPSIYDVSDSVFTISAPAPKTITIISPNGSEKWRRGSIHDITWMYSNMTGDVTVQLYKGAAQVLNIGTIPVGPGVTSWSIPADLAIGDDYKIRIFQGAIGDYSNNYFSIISAQNPPDFNNDGKTDILLRYYGTGGWNQVWYMNGVTKTGNAGIPQVADLNWKIEGTGDFNNDGKTDILLRYYGTGGWNQVWYMNGVTITGTASLPQVADLNWKIEGTGDFNNDGKTDILLRYYGTGGWIQVWYMNGVTKIGTASLPPIADLNWKIEGTGDFNNDGKTDILLRYYGTGGWNQVWYMNGVTKTGTASLPVITDLNWKFQGTGDFNNDGKVDIILRYYGTGGWNQVWYMNGVTKTGTASLPNISDLTWEIVN